MSTVTYLDANRVTAKRQTEPPRNRSRTGYGSKIPSSWILQLDGKRWHRVYVVCWSNSGSAYVIVCGERLFLGSYEPSTDPPHGQPHARPIGPLVEQYVVHEGEPSWHQRRAGHISAGSTVFRGPGAKEKAENLLAGYARHHPNMRAFIRVEYVV